MSRKCVRGTLKGKDSLSYGSGADRFSHPVGGRQIDLNAQNIFQTIFKSANAHQSEGLRFVEVGHQIDIGERRSVAPGHAFATSASTCSGSRKRIPLNSGTLSRSCP